MSLTCIFACVFTGSFRPPRIVPPRADHLMSCTRAYVAGLSAGPFGNAQHRGRDGLNPYAPVATVPVGHDRDFLQAGETASVPARCGNGSSDGAWDAFGVAHLGAGASAARAGDPDVRSRFCQS